MYVNTMIKSPQQDIYCNIKKQNKKDDMKKCPLLNKKSDV